MAQFDYNRSLSTLMVPEVMSALGDVHECKGREALYIATKPEVLERLREVARIQSVGSSNRIENIATSDVRLRALVEQRVEPHDRDEREIAGYRYVLDMIHQSHEHIPVTSGVILQLHRDLYRYQDVSFGGRWKDSDNQIVEVDECGTRRLRFVPTSAAATPGAIQTICEQLSAQLECRVFDPLLVSLVFVFDFVSIHPFLDGNGRMSRLLTLLLAYQSGYDVGRYASIEAEIERTKETYYDALRASSAGWQEGANTYVPFATYMLGVMTACYRTIDERYTLLASGGSNEDKLRAYFDGLLGTVTKRQIMEDMPTMSQRTVERVLQRLQSEGYVEKVGAARSTAYRRTR